LQLFTIANGVEVQVASTKYYFQKHVWELPDDVVAGKSSSLFGAEAHILRKQKLHVHR
jgi:hypothetical protein